MTDGINRASRPLAFADALRARSADAVHWLEPAAIVLAFAILAQALEYTSTDVSWMITLSEKMLGGAKPYVDFIEFNPPGSMYLYMPGVYLAKLTGLPPEFAVAVFGFVAIVGSMTICASILRSAGLADRLGPIGLALAAAILALLPSRAFDQREHLALVAGLPLFAMMIARVRGARVVASLQILAGLGGAIMVAIKPHFALTIAAVLPYLVWRAGWRAVAASLEFYVAALVLLVYALLVVTFFPAYLEVDAPLAWALYAPTREPMLAMLTQSSGFLCWLVLVVYLAVLARDELTEPAVAVPALASLGAVIGFLAQGKAWPYQSYPAVALIALALGFALRGEANISRRLGVGAVWCVAFVAIERLAPGVAAYAQPVTLAICVFFLAVGLLSAGSPEWRARAARLTVPALASAIAFAYVWFSHLNDSPRLQAAASRLGAHLKVMAISQDLGVGFPFTRQIEGVWAQRVPSLWITSSAQRLLEESKDPAERARLESYLRFDRDTLLQDIAENRPDIILISNRFGEFRRWAFADPSIAAALAQYRLYAKDGAASGETFLYARADLLEPQLGATARNAAQSAPPIKTLGD
ncbi:MAG TPA: hypothetical protein VEK35_05290 [Roseiarcus sp.]|nr:hypothetical protein [Roseiarcus sp.]